jgi:hypothetical protein
MNLEKTAVAFEYRVTEILDEIVEGARIGGVGGGTIVCFSLLFMPRLRLLLVSLLVVQTER